MDWQQVVLNGGPPCFALTGELWIDGRRRYCGRAERWHEHGDHPFVGLDDLIAPPAPVTTEAPAQPEVAKTRLTELTYVATTDDGLREIKAWANSRLRADLSLEASVEEPERYARIEDLTNRLSAACAAWNSALRAKNDLAPAAQQLATLRTAAEAIAACETCQRVGFQWDGPGMCEKHAATVATALRDVLAKIGGAKN